MTSYWNELFVMEMGRKSLERYNDGFSVGNPGSRIKRPVSDFCRTNLSSLVLHGFFPFVSHIILREFISGPIYYWPSTICLHAFTVFFTEKTYISILLGGQQTKHRSSFSYFHVQYHQIHRNNWTGQFYQTVQIDKVPSGSINFTLIVPNVFYICITSLLVVHYSRFSLLQMTTMNMIKTDRKTVAWKRWLRYKLIHLFGGFIIFTQPLGETRDFDPSTTTTVRLRCDPRYMYDLYGMFTTMDIVLL